MSGKIVDYKLVDKLHRDLKDAITSAYRNGYEDAQLECIKRAMKIRSAGTWVTDTDPTTEGYYITTIEGAVISTITYWDGIKWDLGRSKQYGVAAWMPMPDAYRPTEEYCSTAHGADCTWL